MKTELKHVASYLPYGLNIGYFFEGTMICKSPMVASMIGNSFAKEIPINSILENDGSCKPILRPLSDLTKEIEHNGEKIIPIKYISTSIADSQQIMRRVKNNQSLDVLEYWKIERLFSMHFDFFGLIDKGLAIDINTLK